MFRFKTTYCLSCLPCANDNNNDNNNTNTNTTTTTTTTNNNYTHNDNICEGLTSDTYYWQYMFGWLAPSPRANDNRLCVLISYLVCCICVPVCLIFLCLNVI